MFKYHRASTAKKLHCGGIAVSMEGDQKGDNKTEELGNSLCRQGHARFCFDKYIQCVKRPTEPRIFLDSFLFSQFEPFGLGGSQLVINVARHD